jgi:hypothetical protein
MAGSKNTDTNADGNNEDGGYDRIHITVPDKQPLQDFAGNHYDGEISHLLRDGFRLLKEQEDGVDMVELELMRSRTETIDEKVDEVIELLSESNAQTQALHAGIDPKTSRENAITNPTEENGTHHDPHEILEILDEHDEPLTMETIVAESNQGIAQLHEALQTLLDEGYLDSTGHGTDTLRYHLTTSATQNQ